jgi:signal transduction histidine kinase
MPYLSRTDTGDVEIDWPAWLPALSTVIPAVVLVAGLVERHALWPPRWPALFAFLALLPFAVDAVTAIELFTKADDGSRRVFRVRAEHSGVRRGVRRLAFSPLLFSAVVISCVGVLIARPLNSDVVPFVLVVLVGEMVSRLGRAQGGIVALASSGLVIGVAVAWQAPGYLLWVAGFAFSYLGGAAVQSQMVLTSRLRQAQSGLAEKAAADERSRIAREVHDVIAHSMSVAMLHITAARMALEKGKSPAALESLREAETQGRKSLADIRHTVGLLGPDANAKAPPMPTATDLPKLVSDFRLAGLDVSLSMDGGVRTLPAAAALNLYRIVQESLTNVAKHAPGAAASVELDVTDSDIRLRVHNTSANGAAPTQSSGGGLGLRGMVERASLLGGSLRADQDQDGWTVKLVAPRPPE